DLTILTGGRAFYRAAGETFRTIQATDFGRARRVWADQNNFGIIGGKGSPRALRQHIATLKIACEKTESSTVHDQLLKRIGKLMGGSATLWVGGTTEHAIQARLETAKRTAASVRGALKEGILPGGGMALMACRPLLQQRRDQCDELEGRAAYTILIKAMESPLRTIASNAGSDPSDVLAELRFAGNGSGFDAKSGQIVDIKQAGIFDPAAVTKAAVYAGIAGAALALSVDVLVHRSEQQEHTSIRTPAKRKKL
ncbi:MAG: hypothetical protein JXA42_03130, partial [Anaerolineales bacterium]|nr:hypothetical protein [Anaerolineales bacterium]